MHLVILYSFQATDNSVSVGCFPVKPAFRNQRGHCLYKVQMLSSAWSRVPDQTTSNTETAFLSDPHKVAQPQIRAFPNAS
jgi:hypothetical protein